MLGILPLAKGRTRHSLRERIMLVISHLELEVQMAGSYYSQRLRATSLLGWSLGEDRRASSLCGLAGMEGHRR